MLPTFRLSALAWLPCAALLLSSPIAAAQTVARPDPATAAAAVPPLVYESPLVRYRAFSDQEVAPWRETNDTAGSIGGWRAYAREAQAPGEPAPSPGTAPAKPGGNNNHHKH